MNYIKSKLQVVSALRLVSALSITYLNMNLQTIGHPRENRRRRKIQFKFFLICQEQRREGIGARGWAIDS